MIKRQIIKLLFRKIGQLKSEDFKSGNDNNNYEIDKIRAAIRRLEGG